MSNSLSLLNEGPIRSIEQWSAGTDTASITVFRDLVSLEPFWQRLETDGHATIFQTWAVFQAWVRHAAERQGLTWVVIGVMRGETTPLMLLPLVVRRSNGLQIIEWADLGVSDFNGPVVARSFHPTAREMQRIWNRILDALPAGDLLHISKMPKFVTGQKNPLLSLPGVHRSSLSAYGTALDGDWNAWAKATIEPKLLKDIAARTRKLEKRGKVEFYVTSEAEQSTPSFDVMCAQRAQRHAAMQRQNILAQPGYRAFYQALFASAQGSGPALIARLTIDGDIIATGYGLADGKAFHMIFPTFKADGWRNYSPGLQLFVRTMQWAAENGYTYFDFTIGGESFKLGLGATERPLYEKAVALSPRGLPFVMANRLKRVVRASPAAAHWAMGALATLKLPNLGSAG